MTLRNGQVQDKKFKRTLDVSIKKLCRKWEGGTLSKWFFVFKQLEKRQNECYPHNLNLTNFSRCTSLLVLMFLISLLKKNLIILKMTNLQEKFVHFSRRLKNRDLFSLQHYCFFYLLTKNFFSRIYRDGIKNIFHSSWRIFRMAKLTGLYYMQINNTYITWIKEL